MIQIIDDVEVTSEVLAEAYEGAAGAAETWDTRFDCSGEWFAIDLSEQFEIDEFHRHRPLRPEDLTPLQREKC
jgi:hypothetical protein